MTLLKSDASTAISACVKGESVRSTRPNVADLNELSGHLGLGLWASGGSWSDDEKKEICHQTVAPGVSVTPAAQIRDERKHDPYSGHLFVFRWRRGDLLKTIWWDPRGARQIARRTCHAAAGTIRTDIRLSGRLATCPTGQDNGQIATGAGHTLRA